MTGNLYRGHFERGGEQIATDVTMEVERVVHYRQFAADPGEGTRDVMRYLCFGERQSAFVAHFITEPPDFDQIAVVTVDASGPSDDDLRAGVLIDGAGPPERCRQPPAGRRHTHRPARRIAAAARRRRSPSP